MNDEEIDKRIKDLDIVEEIENKDVPYVIEQIRGLVKEAQIRETEEKIVKKIEIEFNTLAVDVDNIDRIEIIFKNNEKIIK